MFSLMLCLVFSMLVFSSTIYYVLMLLTISLFLLYSLASNNFLSVLVFTIIIVVYVGAMIILVGYICAISPNVYFSSGLSMYLLPVPLLISFFVPSIRLESSFLVSLSSYFYTSYGMHLFLFLILSLFVTLLIVTSYYISSKGPFRSVNS